MSLLSNQEDARIARVETAFRQALTELHQAPYKNDIIALMQKRRAIQKEKKVAVLGLGPTGIIASIESYLHGYTVVSLDPRKEYSREQAFRFPVTVFESWLQFYFGIKDITQLEKAHPLKKIAELGIFAKRHTRIDESILFGTKEAPEKEHYEIATKHLEELLFSLLELIAEADPKAITIRKGWHFQDYHENRKLLCINFLDNKSQWIIDDVDYVLGCDGLHSASREKANIKTIAHSEPKEYIAAVFYQDTSQSECKDQVEQFKNIKNDSFLDCQKSPLFKTRCAGLYPSRPEKQISAANANAFHQVPSCRVFFTAIGSYFGVEISERTKRNIEKGHTAEQAIISQCRLIRGSIFGVHDDHSDRREGLELQVQKHELRDGRIFKFQLKEAACKYIKLKAGMVFIPLGDANANAHFQTGSGALYGIKSAQEVLKYLGAENEAECIEEILRRIAWELRQKANNFLDVNCKIMSSIDDSYYSDQNLSDNDSSSIYTVDKAINNAKMKLFNDLNQLQTDNKYLIKIKQEVKDQIKSAHKNFSINYSNNPETAQAEFKTECQRVIDDANLKLNKASGILYNIAIIFRNILNGFLKAIGIERSYLSFFGTEKEAIKEVLSSSDFVNLRV